LFNPNPNPRNLKKENPNPNPRNRKKTLSVASRDGGQSQIVIEKLDKNNFQVWKFRIMNFLTGKSYWEFITGDETKPPFPTHTTTNSSQ